LLASLLFLAFVWLLSLTFPLLLLLLSSPSLSLLSAV
jgi:hypothetical protein